MTSMQADDPALPSAELISAYESGIESLLASVAGWTAEQLQARPIPGKWSTIEVVSHMADAEIYFADRIVRTVALDHPLLIAVDERTYPQRLNYQAFVLEEQLALFAAIRKHVARILKMQPEEAWARTAIHTESGLVTLRQLVLQPIRHLRHHLRFIHEKRDALRIPT